jgi:hypothetical protein
MHLHGLVMITTHSARPLGGYLKTNITTFATPRRRIEMKAHSSLKHGDAEMLGYYLPTYAENR